MTRKNRIMAIVAAIVLVASFGVSAVYAVANNPGTESVPELTEIAAQVPEAVVQTPAHAPARALIGFTPEQVDWILYALDNGKLPDLTEEQMAGLIQSAKMMFEQGFAAGMVGIDPEMFDRMFKEFEEGGMDFSAFLGTNLRSSFDGLVARGLDEGMIPPALLDIFNAAVETRELSISDEQIAELQAFAVQLLEKGLAEGMIPQVIYDVAIQTLKTGEFEISDDQMDELKAIALFALEQAYTEEKIPQECYDMIISAIQTGDFAIPDGMIPAEYMEYYDMIVAAVETGDLSGVRAMVPPEYQGYFDAVLAAKETGEIVLTDEQKTGLIKKAKELAVEALAIGLKEGIISQRLYNMLVPGIAVGDIELSIELIAELYSSATALRERCLDEGLITQEQYDSISAAIEEIAIQLAINGFTQR